MKCQRCGKETNVHTMSMLNMDEVCMECKEEERKHPMYKAAMDADRAEIKKGNWNYEGLLFNKDIRNYQGELNGKGE